MAYAKLYCKKRPLRSDGTAFIYLIIKLNGKEKYVSTGNFINPTEWDNKRESTTKPNKYNKLTSILNTEKTKLNNVILDLEREGTSLTFDRIINRYKNNKGEDDFISFAFDELGKLKPGMARKTHEDYYYSLKNLKEFKSYIPFNEITASFLNRYDVWLKSVKKRNESSRYHNFTAIRRFINLAIDEGLTKEYPFRRYKIKQKCEREDIIFLLENDLLKLEELLFMKKFGNRHTRTLANFLFTCYTGIPGQELRKKDGVAIYHDYILYKRTKSDKPVKVPLTSKSKRLIPLVEKLVLKKSYSSVNKDIREILEIAKIKRNGLTYHCGRHTFAINSLIRGISISVISKVLGHTTLRTTEKYVKIVNELLNNEMALWNDSEKPQLPKMGDVITQTQAIKA